MFVLVISSLRQTSATGVPLSACRTVCNLLGCEVLPYRALKEPLQKAGNTNISLLQFFGDVSRFKGGGQFFLLHPRRRGTNQLVALIAKVPLNREPSRFRR
jgi:hypothetical protein